MSAENMHKCIEELSSNEEITLPCYQLLCECHQAYM